MSSLPSRTGRGRAARATLDTWMAQVHGKRVVTIGGGTGPFALLSALKRYPCKPTAIVTMSDNGGSSRRLMDEFGQLPLGDLRQALVALSRNGALWRDTFAFRFPAGLLHGGEPPNTGALGSNGPTATEHGGVGGHSLGNLILSALQSMNDGSLLHAILDAEELLDTAGSVLPVTLSHATLCAELADGSLVCGENEIDTRGRANVGPLVPIARVFLRETTPACQDTVRAIRRADVIVIGPGDLYTSILPNLLVEGIARAVATSEAQKVYVCNLMTKHGETDSFRASDFVREVSDYLDHRPDRVIIHDGSIPIRLLEHYAAEHQHPVEADAEEVRRMVPSVITDQLMSIRGDHLVRHDPDRLIRAIFSHWDRDLSNLEPDDKRRRAFMRGREKSFAWRVDDVD